jgi:hypothetical protein
MSMDHSPSSPTAIRPLAKFFRALLPAVALVAFVGCGSPTTTSSASNPAPGSAGVAGARQAALGLFVKDGPPGHWNGCSNSDNWAACPLSATVKARLASLTSSGYFADVPPGRCGEEYISGTQNGLNQAPTALSAVAQSNGSVTVVIQRGPSSPPNLTAVMTDQDGTWLATDLASGTGPSASIFSAQPSC